MSADPPAVRWSQVACLALLHGSIGLSWIVYALYLPQLLGSLGLAAGLAVTLLAIENLLAIFLEPLFGFLSDQSFRRSGTRLPFIVAGVLLAATLFIATPLAVLTPIAKTDAGRAMFLALVVVWAIAMTVFRTPALALLGRYSTAPNLPRAASILTLIGGGVAALRPGAREFMLTLGPVICFGIGSLVLLLTCGAVWFIDRATPAAEAPARAPPASLIGPLVTLAAAGAGMSLATFAIFGKLLPTVLRRLPPDWPGPERLMAVAFIFFALAALAAGLIASRFGNERTMLIGAGLTAALVAALAWFIHSTASTLLGALALMAAFSLVANGVFPLALGRVPGGRGGLGLGFYFGGLAAVSSLAATRFAAPLSIWEASVLALIGLVVVATAVWAGARPPLRKASAKADRISVG